MATVLVFVIALALVDVLVVAWGADSRGDPRIRPLHPDVLRTEKR